MFSAIAALVRFIVVQHSTNRLYAMQHRCKNDEKKPLKDSFITDVHLFHFSPYISINDKIYVLHSQKVSADTKMNPLIIKLNELFYYCFQMDK